MKRQAQSIARLPIETKEGIFFASYSQDGLCRLEFPKSTKPSNTPETKQVPGTIQGWHELTTKAVMALLAGAACSRVPPLDLTSGTEFQQQVWRGMQKIDLGQTSSYAELAAAIGKPKATRAVGGACGANPIPLLVPCHRVVASHHRLGGFSGGLHWKRLLLDREQCNVFA